MKIEDNSVIGAGTVISKNVKKNEVIVGNQQRLLKKLTGVGKDLKQSSLETADMFYKDAKAS